jgi:hypothetical protein
VFSPSELIGELVSSDQVSDLSTLSTPGAFSFTPGIVSVSELSAAELAQSVINKIQCPEGTIIWIGDTGALQHSSKSKEGAINIRNAGQTSVGSTGQHQMPQCTFNLPGQFIKHDGSLELWAVITDVSYNSQNNFNLFSLRGPKKSPRSTPKLGRK